MKHLKLFEEYVKEPEGPGDRTSFETDQDLEDAGLISKKKNNYGYTEPDINPEQRKIVADIVKNGILLASGEYHDDLEKGFEVHITTYEGSIDDDEIDEREDSERIYNELSERIEDGENFGIISAEPLNLEWELKWGV